MKYFTISELCRSNVAERLGIDNIPNQFQQNNMVKLIENLLDPIRKMWGAPIYVNSGFRTARLNEAIGGAINSEHLNGCAADIRAVDIRDNGELFTRIIESGIPFRQLIWEQGTMDYPQWIHISYNESDNKRQIIRL